jgi:hypothetical protein
MIWGLRDARDGAWESARKYVEENIIYWENGEAKRRPGVTDDQVTEAKAVLMKLRDLDEEILEDLNRTIEHQKKQEELRTQVREEVLKLEKDNNVDVFTRHPILRLLLGIN